MQKAEDLNALKVKEELADIFILAV